MSMIFYLFFFNSDFHCDSRALILYMQKKQQKPGVMTLNESRCGTRPLDFHHYKIPNAAIQFIHRPLPNELFHNNQTLKI